nr:hypothetical protein [Tanacetum cinerariifolium]GEY87286.1 hypothetical protein [Tanacetum cinerariifolium]
MVNVIPLDHVDEVPVVELNQHDDVSVVHEPVLVDEDEDVEEDEFKGEEDPQEEEDDMKINVSLKILSRTRKPNGDALRKCILNGPYIPTTVLAQAVAAIDDSLTIPEHTTDKTPMNMSPAKKAHFEAKKEVIHLILTGIGDEIYSTVDACQTA